MALSHEINVYYWQSPETIINKREGIGNSDEVLLVTM